MQLNWRVSVTSTRTPLRLRRKAMNASVSPEANTPLQTPQRRCRDLDRFRGVAIVFGRYTLQRFVIKDYFAMGQPKYF